MLARNATSPDVLGCPAMAVVSWHDDSWHCRQRRGWPSWFGCCVPTFPASVGLSGIDLLAFHKGELESLKVKRALNVELLAP
jgi:hypothetical protein